MSEQNPVPDAPRPVDPRSDLPAGADDPTTQTTAQGPAMSGAPVPPVPAATTPVAPVTPGQGSLPVPPVGPAAAAAAAADLEATVPLMPAVNAPAWGPAGQPVMPNPTPPGGWPPQDPGAPWAQGQQPYGQAPYGQQPYGQPPFGPGPYGTPVGGTPVPPYVAAGWDPNDGPQAGTAYGTRPPTPPSGSRRGAAGSGGDGSGRTPSAVIVGSVIGVAAILALAVWFVLLRPGDNTASSTPTPGVTTFVTPPPTATPEASFSFEPGETATPEPTRFRNPTFAGLRITDAEDLAFRSNVTIRVTYEVTDEVDPDTVISQDPPAGDPILPGDTIVLTVAAPAPTVGVPDLRDFIEADAVAAMLDAGLAPGERTEAYDPDTDAGRVIRTDPRGGLQVARETLVDYVVSLGAEPSPSPTPLPTELPAPSLVGLTGEEAQALADEQGFVLVIDRQETLDDDEGTVLSQDPETDTPIRPGDTVRIVVAVRPATVVVPVLRELLEADAVSVLIDAGLVAGERSEAFDPEIAAGAVIRTDPRAGIAVAPGTPVDYLVSLGAEPTQTPEPTPSPVQVPDLVGLPVEEAQAIVDDAGLLLETQERETLDADPGIVLEQDPELDTPVQAGSTIQVVIAARPASIAVPVLRGLSEDEALAALEAAALVPGERSTRFHASVPAGAVIRSDPAAGTIVALDSTVDYVVSLGVEPTPSPSPTTAPIDVPGLTGRTLVDAQAFADANGIQLDIVDQETEDAPPDTILDQDPPEGAQLRPGDTVRVIVARQPANVTVPPLRGLSEADAIATLLDVDLTPGERTERFHASVPAGAVISSDPRAGASIARGGAVDYVLSRGPEPTPSPSPTPAPIVVPAFVGGPVGDAQRFADENGLTTDITTTETADAPPDTVLEQDPSEGGELQPGGVLRLVIATPPTTAAVPDVRGQAEADAIAQILDAGLAVGTRTERFHGSLPPGAVIRTNPAADAVVALGTVVDYLVSMGPEPTASPTPEPTPTPIELPRLVGGDRADAQAFADASGLTLDVTEQETTDAPTGTILDQDPPAGRTLVAGETLRIVVAVAPALVAVPDVRGQSEADGIAAIVDAGLAPGRRIDRFNDTVPAERIIRTSPAADEQVAPGTAVDYVMSRGPEPTPTPNPAPDLRGQTRADAQALAESRGFTLDVTEQETADAAPDTVIDQDPAPDTDLPDGSAIRVTVAIAPPLVSVPALRGLSEADGVALLVDAGLAPGRRIDRFNDAVPVDQIVRTDPAADEQVPAGTTVDYVVSKGPEPVPAPDLVGISIDEARSLADAAGLTLDVTEQDDDRVPTGTVLSQDPAAGDPLTDTTIAVVVARSTQLVAVPALRGLSEADGVALLAEAGLAPGRRIDRFHDTVPADQIVRTDPAADTQVAPGTTVDYVVSKGPEPAPVPDVTGFPVGEAEGIARDSGLTLDVTFEDTRDVAPDTVISQDPAAGAPADGSGTVRVVVARAPSDVEVPRLRGLPEDDAIGLLRDAGLRPGDRTERSNPEIPAGAVIGSDPRPGTLVASGTRVSYVVSTGQGGGTATPEPTPDPTAPPTTDPGGSGDPTALLDGVVADVPPLRELDLVAGIPYRTLTVKEWRRELKAAMEAITPPEAIAAEAATLARLGLIPPDLDLEQARLDLLANGVVAWYDPSAKVLNVVKRDGALDAVVRFFAAGEVDKALIDGLVGLSSWRPDDPTQTDRSAARAALLGGDQALLMIDWAGQALTPDEQAQLPGLLPTDPGLLQSAPLYLRRQLTFPTDAGRSFVESLRNAGGWAAVNDAFARPPGSTEQILHPEKYRVDKPVAVDIPDLTGLPGSGWSVTDVRTFGELGIGAWLDDGVDGSPNAWAADGWGGDRALTLDGPDGAWAVVWQTAWDSDTDADEFSGMADQAMADLPGAHVVLRGADVTGSGLSAPALVVVASDQSVVDAILSGSGIGG